jgi:predicted GIY-YIG superfamily endonuclease
VIIFVSTPRLDWRLVGLFGTDGQNFMLIDELFNQLGLQTRFPVLGKTSIQAAFTSVDHCGIYVLHFEDGDFYIGQSIDIAKRFRQHATRVDFGSAIHFISFKLVDRWQLNQVEKDTIQAFKDFQKTLPKEQKFRLKNIKDNEYKRGASPFDIVMLPEDQERWLEDLNWVDNHGDFYESEELRKQYEARFNNQFRIKPYAQIVAQIMRDYVRATIPAIRQGEGLYWACSCMPSADVYSRINISWQEVFTAYYDRHNDVPCFAFQLAYKHTEFATWLDPIFNFFKELSPTTFVDIKADNYKLENNGFERTHKLRRKDMPEIREVVLNISDLAATTQQYAHRHKIRLENYGLSKMRLLEIQNLLVPLFEQLDFLSINSHQYDAGGEDQIRVEIVGIDAPYQIINHPEFRRGMREMNLRLMRQGTSKWASNHCLSLADYLVGRKP